MKKKTIHSTLSNLAAAALLPLVFACAHSPADEGPDGYAGLDEFTPVLSEPTELDSFFSAPELAEVIATPEPSNAEVAAAQRKISKNGQRHKKVRTPFQAPVAQKAPAPPAPAPAPSPSAEAVVEDKEPPTTVVRNGSVLNRYYFVRAGDTPEGLSRMFFQSPHHAAELVEWNGPAVGWTPGTTLYYRSATNPDDNQLLSFYFEAGVPTEEVYMEAGETLKSIANRKLGSEESWKEIAALNGFAKGEQPEAGMALKVYPFPLLPAPAVAEVKKQEKAPKLASTQLGGFIQHNPLLVACSAVALVLLFGYFVMQRRRYRSRFDF